MNKNRRGARRGALFDFRNKISVTSYNSTLQQVGTLESIEVSELDVMLVRRLGRQTVWGHRRRSRVGKRVRACVKSGVPFVRGSVAAFVVSR
jgi:hypothetical protein